MKRKKMAKWLMAEGITRNEADAFSRVYRKLSSQKKGEKLLAFEKKLVTIWAGSLGMEVTG